MSIHWETMKKAAAGFEPANNGFANRRLESVSNEKTNTCESTKTPLTPQWTPDDPESGQNQSDGLSPDLIEIMDAWPDLPDGMRSSIMAIVRASRG
jgi:hypothetical protein